MTERLLRTLRRSRPAVVLILAIVASNAAPVSARRAQPVIPPAPVSAPTTLEQRAAMLAAIDAAIAAGRLDSARAMIGRTLPTDPSPELQLRLAELALATGDIAGAGAQFTELAAEPTLAARAQQGLGLARLRQGNLPAATAAIEAALAAEPGLLRAWNARGVIADRQRDFPAADKAYAAALAIDPRSVAVLTNRGYSRSLRALYAGAELDLAAAAAIDPASSITQTNLRFARAMQGRYRDAFSGSTKETLANDLNTVGFAAMARGDTEAAETYFNRAMSLNTRFDRVAWANIEYLQSHRKTQLDPDAVLASDRSPGPTPRR